MQANNVSRKHKCLRQALYVGTHSRHRTHRAAKTRTLEIVRCILLGNRQGKGPEPFSMLDKVVEIFFDVRSPWRSQDTAVAKRARTEFRGTLKPCDDLARLQKLHHSVGPALLSRLQRRTRLAVVQDIFDLGPPVRRSEVDAVTGFGARFS